MLVYLRAVLLRHTEIQVTDQSFELRSAALEANALRSRPINVEITGMTEPGIAPEAQCISLGW